MRRRTKPRVVWLPKDVGSTLQNTNIINEVFTISAGAAPGDTVIDGGVSVVIDFPAVPTGGVDTLSDVENSGYRLRRIVGKCFVGIEQSTQTDSGAIYLVACGFLIVRCDQAGAALDPTFAQYSHFPADNDDIPWIWKREWIVQDLTASTGGTFAKAQRYPTNNASYGSVSDGPHIDQKTARIVSQNERLFFITSVINLAGGVNQATNDIRVICTPRVLASMRTSSGNRRNASR